MASKRATPHLKVGVFARSKGSAASLAAELKIANALPLSERSIESGRGCQMQALIVDSDCWPISNDLWAVLMPALSTTKGYIHVVERTDPKTLGDRRG